MSKKKVVIFIAIFLFASLSGWYATKFYLSMESKDKITHIPGATAPVIEIHPDGRQALVVKIFYPSEDGVQLKEKKIFTNLLPVNIAEEVIKEYLKELKDGLRNTRLLGVYRDANNTIYINLSDDFRRYFSDSARFEYYLLESFLKTILQNVPEAEDVRLLIEGKEIESIGGHFICIPSLKTSIHFSAN